MLDINSNLNQLADQLNLSLNEISDLANIPSHTKKRAQKNFSKASITSLFELADNLDVNFEKMIEGTLDYTALREHRLGNKKFVPVRYQQYMKSKVSTINNALTIAKRYLGEDKIESIKKKLQINDELLKRNSESISGLLLIDIFSEIEKYDPNEAIFYHIGTSLCKSHMKAALKNFEGNNAPPIKTFEMFIENIHSSVEYNMEYKILSTNQKNFVIAVNTREQAKDTLGTNTFGTNLHYQNIIGYYNQISRTILDAPAKITTLNSWKGETAELMFALELPIH